MPSRLAQRSVFAILLTVSCTIAVGAAAAPTPVVDPFVKGSRYWSLAGGASIDASYGWMYLTQMAVSYYIADNWAMMCGGIVGRIDSTRMPNGLLGGPEVGVRWHFAKRARWSTYLESVVGAVFQQHPISQDSLRFNFDLQPGGGIAYHPGGAVMARGGFRWHHLSNAGIHGSEHNLGYDGPMLYLELLHAF